MKSLKQHFLRWGAVELLSEENEHFRRSSTIAAYRGHACRICVLPSALKKTLWTSPLLSKLDLSLKSVVWPLLVMKTSKWDAFPIWVGVITTWRFFNCVLYLRLILCNGEIGRLFVVKDIGRVFQDRLFRLGVRQTGGRCTPSVRSSLLKRNHLPDWVGL